MPLPHVTENIHITPTSKKVFKSFCPDLSGRIFDIAIHHYVVPCLKYVRWIFFDIFSNGCRDTIENLQNLMTWNFHLSLLPHKVVVLNSISMHCSIACNSTCWMISLLSRFIHSLRHASSWKVKSQNGQIFCAGKFQVEIWRGRWC